MSRKITDKEIQKLAEERFPIGDTDFNGLFQGGYMEGYKAALSSQEGVREEDGRNLVGMNKCPNCGTLMIRTSKQFCSLGCQNAYDLKEASEQSAEDADKDAFAISFAVWALHDPQAKAFQEAGISAYGLLEKYKSRVYVDSNTSNQ